MIEQQKDIAINTAQWDSIIAKHCTCHPFKDAQQAGTDNEAYGELIRFWGGEWKAGCDLRRLK